MERLVIFYNDESMLYGRDIGEDLELYDEFKLAMRSLFVEVTMLIPPLNGEAESYILAYELENITSNSMGPGGDDTKPVFKFKVGARCLSERHARQVAMRLVESYDKFHHLEEREFFDNLIYELELAIYT